VAPLILKPFQAEDVATLMANNYRAIVANAPGTGKTIITLACVKRDFIKLTPTVIVCPASVVTNWCREARKWLGHDIRIHAIADTTSPMPRVGNVHIVVVSWALMAMRVREIAALGPRFLVADEAHYAKSDVAMRTRCLAALAKRTPHVVLLTGTPIINKKAELDTLQELFGTTEVPMLRRFLEEAVPEIPVKTRNTLPITIRPDDMREYRKAEEEFSSWLQGELQTRMSAGMARITAQRALAAEALVKSGYLRRLLGKAKVYAAADWVSRAVRLGEPVVVFCEHQEVIAMLQELLRKQRIGNVVISGEVSRRERQRAIDAFQAGMVPVFIGTKAASTGITLVRSRHLMFLERYWTSAEEEQAEDRIRRIGQTKPTNIWFLHATETIDDRVDEVIGRKRRLVAQTIGAWQTDEQDEDAVFALLDSWNNTVASPFAGKESDLGMGKPLPPLPKRADVCSLVFKGARWTKSAALAWVRLHNYPMSRVTVLADSIKVECAAPSAFRQGTFAAVPVTGEIKAIQGVRIDHSTKRRVVVSRSRKAG
jgi:superfamily II DNA or RNA helicase